MLQWLTTEVNAALEVRKEDIKGKRIGALFSSNAHPCLIWVKMILRPFIKNHAKGYIFGQANHFNAALQEVVGKIRNNCTIELEIPADKDLFDLSGHLSINGQSRYWRELTRMMRMLDKEEYKCRMCQARFEADQERNQTNYHPNDQLRRTNIRTQDFRTLSLDKSYHQFHCN